MRIRHSLLDYGLIPFGEKENSKAEKV